MKKNSLKYYENIIGLEFLGNSSNKKILRIARRISGIANRKIVFKLLRKFKFNTVGQSTLYDLENSFIKYAYYISDSYLVVVHFETDYVFKIKRSTDEHT